MKLLRLQGIDYTSLSSSALDDAYAAADTAGDSQTRAAIGVVIIDRLATPLGFVDSLMTSVLGGGSFPQYDAIQTRVGGFVGSSAATQAVSVSAGNLATQAGTAIKTIAGSGILILLAGGAIAVAYLFRKK